MITVKSETIAHSAFIRSNQGRRHGEDPTGNLVHFQDAYKHFPKLRPKPNIRERVKTTTTHPDIR